MASKPFDPTIKALVETSPEDWPVLLGYPQGPVAVIDADVATVSGAGDKVLRVTAAAPDLCHLGFKAGHASAALPKKLHVRNALLGNRHDLPVRSVMVLLRPEADSPVLKEPYTEGFEGEEPYLTFRYRVLRVWQLDPKALLRGGRGTLPLAPLGAVTEADLPGINTHMDQPLT